MEQANVVRVDFPSERMTKKMIFDFSACTVAEASEKIMEKMTAGRQLKTGTQISDYCLYIPPGGRETPTGVWLTENASLLSQYPLEQRGVVEYRLRPRGISVNWVPNDSGSSLGSVEGLQQQINTEVDFTAPIANVSLRFVQLLRLPAPSVHEQYSLYYQINNNTGSILNSSGGGSGFVNGSAALDPQASLLDAGVPYDSTVTLRLEQKPGKLKKGAVKGKKLLGKSISKAMMLRRGSTNNGSGKGNTGELVFGIPLKQVIVNGSVALVDDCIAYVERRALDLEGIFRLSGSANEIQALKKRYNNGERVDLSTVLDPHVVCGIFKLWLRELPEPLFTWVNYEPLLQVQMNSDDHVKIRYLRAVIQGLPEDHKRIVKQLLDFQRNIISHEAQNKMAIHNVATVFAPNLLRSIEEGATPIVEDTSKVLGVTCVMIKNTEAIFSPEEEFCGIAEAIYDFRTEKDYELSFSKGDVVFVRSEDDGGWWSGEIAKTGESGLFPSNYVQVKQTFNGGGNAAVYTPISANTTTASARGSDRRNSESVPSAFGTRALRSASHSVSSSMRVDAVDAASNSASLGKGFAAELDEIRELYATEHAARLKLDAEATAIQAEISLLRQTVRQIAASNAELRSVAFG